jgi:hypothetical protein
VRGTGCRVEEFLGEGFTNKGLEVRKRFLLTCDQTAVIAHSLQEGLEQYFLVADKKKKYDDHSHIKVSKIQTCSYFGADSATKKNATVPPSGFFRGRPT